MQTWGANQGLLTNPLLHLGAGLLARSGYQPGPKQPFGALLGQSMMGVPEGVAQGQRINNLRERVGLISAQKQALQTEAAKANRIAELRAGLLGGGEPGMTYSAPTPPGVTVNPMGSAPAPSLLTDAAPTVGPAAPEVTQSTPVPAWAPTQAAGASPSLLAAQPQAEGGGLLGGLDPRIRELASLGDPMALAQVKEHMTRGRPQDPTGIMKNIDAILEERGLTPGTPEYSKQRADLLYEAQMKPDVSVTMPGVAYEPKDPVAKEASDRLYSKGDWQGPGTPINPKALRSEMEQVRREQEQREVTKEDRVEQRQIDREVRAAQRKADTDFKQFMQTKTTIQSELDQLDKLIKAHGIETIGANSATMATLYGDLKLQLKNYNELGQLQGPDTLLLEQLVGDPTAASLNPYKASQIRAQIKALKDLMKQREGLVREKFGQSPRDVDID